MGKRKGDMGKKKGRERQSGAPSPALANMPDVAVRSRTTIPIPVMESSNIRTRSRGMPNLSIVDDAAGEATGGMATGSSSRRKRNKRSRKGKREHMDARMGAPADEANHSSSPSNVVNPIINAASAPESGRKRKRVELMDALPFEQKSKKKRGQYKNKVLIVSSKDTTSGSREASVASKASASTTTSSYMPILQSQMVPPHLRHPFRSYPSTAKFDISQAIQSDPATEKRPSDEYFDYAARTPHTYWANVDPERQQQDIMQRRKLVVLDLNGALVVRSERTTFHVAQAQRKVFPRPFLNCFLDFLMSAICKKADKPPITARPERMRPFEVFIWSSVQPKSIEDMVSPTFGKWGDSISGKRGTRQRALKQMAEETAPEAKQGRILGVWTRSDMGLTHEQYFQKSATSKDLDKLYKHFTRDNKFSGPYPRFFYPDPMFLPDPTNTLLIDDSTDKASLQPYNHLPILEFEWAMLKNSAEAVEAHEQVNGVSEILEPAEALRLIFGRDARDFYRKAVFTGTAKATSSSEEKTVDGILLAIIGILSEIKDVQSIPAWIAAGGLRPDIGHTFTQDIAERGWDHVIALDAVRQDSSNQERKGWLNWKKRKVEDDTTAQDISSRGHRNDHKSSEPNTKNIPAHVPMDPRSHVVQPVLPSHPDYQHWYDSPLHVLYWVRRGLIALEEREVPLQHNMTGVAERLQQAERERRELDEAVSVRREAALAELARKAAGQP